MPRRGLWRKSVHAVVVLVPDDFSAALAVRGIVRAAKEVSPVLLPLRNQIAVALVAPLHGELARLHAVGHKIAHFGVVHANPQGKAICSLDLALQWVAAHRAGFLERRVAGKPLVPHAFERDVFVVVLYLQKEFGRVVFFVRSTF